MAVVAPKKKPLSQPASSKREGYRSINMQLDEELAVLIERYMKSQPFTAKHVWTPFFRQLAIDFFKSRGLWPPKPDDGTP